MAPHYCDAISCTCGTISCGCGTISFTCGSISCACGCMSCGCESTFVRCGTRAPDGAACLSSPGDARRREASSDSRKWRPKKIPSDKNRKGWYKNLQNLSCAQVYIITFLRALVNLSWTADRVIVQTHFFPLRDPARKSTQCEHYGEHFSWDS